MSKGLVLVTGAKGTVGQYAVDELLRQGYAVRATDICETHGHAFVGRDYSYEQGDLCDKKFVKKIVRGVYAVIHLAAIIDVGLDWKELCGVNYHAVRALYFAAAEAKVKVFVFASSGSIYAPTNNIRDENARLKTYTKASAYELTKILSEEALRDDRRALLDNNQYAPEFVIFRPALIYGPRNRFLAAVYLAIAIILHELFGDRAPHLTGGPKTNMVHAEDVARAAVYLMEHPQTWGQTYNVADDDPRGFGDHATEMAHGLGFKTDGPTIPLPGPGIIGLASPIYNRGIVLALLNKALGFPWDWMTKAHGIKPLFRPIVNDGMTPFFGNHTIFGNQKLKDTGFKLKHPRFAEGFREVAKWYQDNGWAPRS